MLYQGRKASYSEQLGEFYTVLQTAKLPLYVMYVNCLLFFSMHIICYGYKSVSCLRQASQRIVQNFFGI